MSDAKKNVFQDTVNTKIQRRFDLVFDRSNKSKSSSDFINIEAANMFQNKKQELTSVVEDKIIDIDFDLDSRIDESDILEIKNDTNTRLSVVPDFKIDQTLPELSNKDDFAIEFSGTNNKTEIASKKENQNTSNSSSTLDLMFDEAILIGSLAMKEGTQKTIVFDKNQLTNTENDFDPFVEDELLGESKLSAESMSTEEALANMETTINDILKPNRFDATEEIDLTEFKTQDQAEITFYGEAKQIESMVFNLSPQSEKTDSNGFDLSSVEFADNEIYDEMAAANSTTKDYLAIEKTAIKPKANVQLVAEIEPPPIQTIQQKNINLEGPVHLSASEETRFLATIRQLREEREDLLSQIKKHKAEAKEFEQDNLTLKAALDESKIEISILRKRHLVEIEDMKYRLSLSDEKRLLAEERAKLSESKREKLEQKVRIDFNQVKLREKELETKLEMLSIDVDSQVHSRDQKILELRRKIDALEFNMENVSIRDQKSQDDKRKVEDKLNKIMKTLRYSIKNLEDDIDQAEDDIQDARNDEDRSKT